MTAPGTGPGSGPEVQKSIQAATPEQTVGETCGNCGQPVVIRIQRNTGRCCQACAKALPVGVQR